MKNLKSLIIVILLVLACAPTDQSEQRGNQGEPGADGGPGKSVKVNTVTVEDIDRSGDWDDQNIVLSKRSLVLIPDRINVAALTQNENGGWLDVYVGDATFCFQGQVGQKYYNFKYKKIDGYSDGCDSNNEKETNAFAMSAIGEVDDKVGVVPRAPRLNGVVWDLELNVFEEQ